MTEIDVAAVRVRAEAAQEIRDQALYALSYGDDGHRKFWEPADASARDVPHLLAAHSAAVAALGRVEALTRASDDGSEWEHNDRCEGEPTCPACWTAAIRAAVQGDHRVAPLPPQRIVQTREELAVLPDQTVIRDQLGITYLRGNVRGYQWNVPGQIHGADSIDFNELDLPATVLWLPPGGG